MNFADRLHGQITSKNTVLCVGFDPILETFPKCVLELAKTDSASDEDFIRFAIRNYFELAIDALSPYVAAVKPNLAFFEQYGIAGMLAFSDVLAIGRDRGALMIADAKRGDIGSTAVAYSTAFLGKNTVLGKSFTGFSSDAVTVNPFLGVETVLPFLEECASNDKGIFVLVRTSNTGSSELQGTVVQGGKTPAEMVAAWINTNSTRLVGKCGLSSLGAVVGATHPKDAIHFRKLMPKSYILIPGFGAQGATADDSVSAFCPNGSGGIVNASRALFNLPDPSASISEIKHQLGENGKSLRDALNAAKNRFIQRSVTQGNQ